MFDYHVHTSYSPDSQMLMETACSRAVELGLKEIAITDHIDIDWPDSAFPALDARTLDQYFEDLTILQEKFKGCLSVKKGIEIGLQPHVLGECSDIIQAYPFDFVIASVHLVNGVDPYLGEYYADKTKEESYQLYYREVLSLIKSYDEFDVLGHLDYIKRYSPFPADDKDHLICSQLTDDIIITLIKKGKGLEINTSGYRHESKTPMPHLDIINRYRQFGVKIITLGSDAHRPEHIALGFDNVLKEIKKSGFSYLTSFTGRIPEYVPIP